MVVTIAFPTIELARQAFVDTVAGSAAFEWSAKGTWQQARFNWPTGIAVRGLNLCISDMANATIRQFRIGDGIVSTVAGPPGSNGSTDGRGTSALFHLPRGLVANGRTCTSSSSATTRYERSIPCCLK